MHMSECVCVRLCVFKRVCVIKFGGESLHVRINILTETMVNNYFESEKNSEKFNERLQGSL